MRDRRWKSLVLTVMAMVGLAGVVPTVAAGQTPASGSLVEAPSSVVAVQGDAHVELRWEASAGAIEYAVWRDGGWYDWAAAPANTYTDVQPLSGATYQIRALGADGSWSKWSAPVDVVDPAGQLPTPPGIPATPSGVVAEADTSGVRLTWNAVPGAVEYAVWRDGDWYDWVAAPGVAYLDTDPPTTAGYQIRAVGRDGSWSSWSDSVEVTADDSSGGGGDLDTELPSEVTGIRVLDKRPDDFVTLSWDAGVDNGEIAFYEIFVHRGLRGFDALDEAQLFTTSTNEITISDSADGGLWLGQDFGNSVWIRAVDEAGNRGPLTLDYSSFIYVTEANGVILLLANEYPDFWLPADGPAPDVVVSEGGVELTWRTIIDNQSAASQVYRDGEFLAVAAPNGDCSGPDCELVDDRRKCSGTDCVYSYVDTDVVPGQTYTYHVRGRDIQGNLSPNWETVTETAS